MLMAKTGRIDRDRARLQPPQPRERTIFTPTVLPAPDKIELKVAEPAATKPKKPRQKSCPKPVH